MQVSFASVCTFQVLLLFVMLHSYICCWKKPVSLDCFSDGFWEEVGWGESGTGNILHSQFLHFPASPCHYLTCAANTRNPTHSEKQSQLIQG